MKLFKALIASLSIFMASTQAMSFKDVEEGILGLQEFGAYVLKEGSKLCTKENGKKLALVSLPVMAYNADNIYHSIAHQVGGMHNMKKLLGGSALLAELLYLYMNSNPDSTILPLNSIKMKLKQDINYRKYILGALVLATHIMVYKSETYSHATVGVFKDLGLYKAITLTPTEVKNLFTAMLLLAEGVTLDLYTNGFEDSYTNAGLNKAGLDTVSKFIKTYLPNVMSSVKKETKVIEIKEEAEKETK